MFALMWTLVIVPAAFLRKVKLNMAYGALQGVDLAGVGLDLVTELHSLLLGLSQCIVVLVHSLVQI